ncbi:MAG: DnaJ domain-containing protein [Bacteroidota bacterium]|nr:DnaJ domain-containing protein [Bacteroidota bacterium]
MTFFELFGFKKPSFFIDEDQVKSVYYSLSKKHHPDLLMNDPEAHSKAVEMTSKINKAYSVLKSFYHRLAYVLELEGLLDKQRKEDLPMDFLMEMMELNEAKEDNNPIEIEKEIQQKLSNLETKLLYKCKNFDLNQSSKVLSEIKELYLKRKYLIRLL